MLRNGKVGKRTTIWSIDLMRQTLIKIESATETEVNILKT